MLCWAARVAEEQWPSRLQQQQRTPAAGPRRGRRRRIPRAFAWAACATLRGVAGAGDHVGDCELVRLDAGEPRTQERFASEIRGRRPALLTNATAKWKLREWSYYDWQDALGDVDVPLRLTASVAELGAWHGARHLPGSVVLDPSWRGFNLSDAPHDAMVFSSSRRDPAVRRLLEMRALPTPAPLPSIEDIHRHPVLSIGGRGDGLPYHQHGEAWLALLYGSKEWYFRAPDALPSPATLGRVKASALASEEGTLRCVQRQGEVVYVPENWWHATYNVPHHMGHKTIGVGGHGASADAASLAACHGDLNAMRRHLGMEDGEEDREEGDAKAAADIAASASAPNASDAGGAAAARGKDAIVPMSSNLLHEAAAAGHVSVLTWLLENGGAASSEPNPEHVHAAVTHGHVETLALLVARRASLESTGASGSAAVHVAAQHGHADLMDWLLRNRASATMTDASGRQPLRTAAGAGAPPRVLELLLQHGAAADAPDEAGATALHVAAAGSYVDALPLLVEHRASMEATAANATRPSHWAALAGHVPVLSWLAERGAELDAEDAGGSRPVHAAAASGHVKALSWLVRRGAEPISSEKANEFGHARIVQWLQARKREREL